MPGNAILLSTKNGERFVKQQIDSLMTQSQRWRLYWRDDGSTDDTIPIVQKLGVRGPLAGTKPIGVTRSYARLLQMAWKDGCDYFALADQDDVWRPFKLERALNYMKDITGPALYCARQTLVDAELKPIGSSPQLHGPIGFPAALTQNIAAGCTIVMNREAADLVRTTLSDQPYHDWWCYLIVSAAGGRIIADPAEVILYRQHGENTVGAAPSYWRRAIAATRRGRAAFMVVFRKHIALLQQHAALLTPEARRQVQTIANALDGGRLARWRALRLPGFRRQTTGEHLLFRLWFLLG